VRKRLKEREMSCRDEQKSAGNSERETMFLSNLHPPPPGVLYEYQKKEVAGKGFWKNMKMKELPETLERTKSSIQK